MEQRRYGKRRRFSPCNPISGMFTRSRGEIFLHRSRSGRCRQDPGRWRYPGPLVKVRKPESSPESLTSVPIVFDDALPSSVIDLRARRVFSPASLAIGNSPVKKRKIESDLDATRSSADEREESPPEGAFCDQGTRNEIARGFQSFPSNGEEDLNESCDGNLHEIRIDEVELDSEYHGEDLQRKTRASAGSFGEDSCHSTPPDIRICRNSVSGEGASSVAIVGPDLQRPVIEERENPSTTGVSVAGLSFTQEGCESTKKEGRTDCRRGPKLVRCSRRLFPPPNSLSYRRLLPYLMGLAEENTSVLDILSSKRHPMVTVQTHAEENPRLPLLDFIPNEVENCAGTTAGLELSIVDSESYATEKIPIGDCPNLGCAPNPKDFEPNPAKCVYKNEPEITTSPSVCNETSPPVDQVMSRRCDSHGLELTNNSLNSVHVRIEDFPKEKHQELSSKVEESSNASFLAPAKGILKTNPHRCRGFCKCCGCSSFCLNAEKSHEFCRKQMVDTEEIVMGLLEELSFMRSVIERVESAICGVRDNSPSPIQDKGICRKATKAEELARDRLRQMAQEVNTYCKTVQLDRPRVAFADHVDKLVFDR